MNLHIPFINFNTLKFKIPKMSNSIAEGKLAKFIQYIASTEADVKGVSTNPC